LKFWERTGREKSLRRQCNFLTQYPRAKTFIAHRFGARKHGIQLWERFNGIWDDVGSQTHAT